MMMTKFGAVGLGVLFALVFADVDCAPSPPQQCPEVMKDTCLPSSMPVIKELKTTDVATCCAACITNPDCVSWTVNTKMNECHLRATFKPNGKTQDRDCTSGHVRDGPTPPPPIPPAPPGVKNVLMIVVDDLRPQLGAYNVSVCNGIKMVTPNIDKLASRGLTFKHHYNQYSVCSPSRNSFMSGRRPDTTLVYNFKDNFRKTPVNGSEFITLPQYFKVHGYNTTGCGKTFHSGAPPNFDEPLSWTEGVPYQGYNQGLGFCGDHCACALGVNDTQHFTDDGLAARAIELMTSHKANNVSPWFVAVGFIRPHVDWSAPQRFWDLYPESQCSNDVALHKTPPPGSPKIAWVDGGYVDKKSGDVGPNYHFNASIPVNDSVANTWRRGYYAAVSYMDWNVGKVLDALDDLGFAQNTVVGFFADHGYQIGEHGMWEKYTNWELAARVPFILAVPWKTKSHGMATDALTENVDVYPSLATIAGLPTPMIACVNCIEGDDVSPLLDTPTMPWKAAAFSQYARCALDNTTGYYTRCSGTALDALQTMGYSIRTGRWRYVEWFPFNDHTLKANMNITIAKELYDHGDDAGNDMDFTESNVVDDPNNAAVVSELALKIRQGWIAQRPQTMV
eukprot:m.215491 g.215491  ORF g.215491 m.215491 type:complete len:620 (+) comp33188_c0_seq1:219-2078(+)